MSIQNIPEKFLKSKKHNPALFVYDFKMTQNVVKSKVNLTVHMFSFLQNGEKKVQLEDASVEVNNKQSVLIKAGNCLMTELLNNDEIYYCKLFFFTNENIASFFEKHPYLNSTKNLYSENPFFVIENDEFINSFVTSISSILHLTTDYSTLLNIKFEEIMLYLSHKYGDGFTSYIQSICASEKNSTFKNIVEATVHSNLSLQEISFLANMSLSTFKRNFTKAYGTNPGKWLQQKRLHHAKKILETGFKKPTEIFANYGYNNFSNFSTAFKNEFGFSPKNVK